MNCEQVRKKLNAYMDAELPEETIEKITTHLEKCQDCSGAITRLQSLTSVLEEVSTPEVPKGFTARVLACANERSKSTKSMQRKHAFVFQWYGPKFLTARTAAAAAVLIFGLVIGGLMGLDIWQSPNIQSGGESQMTQVEPTDIYNLDYLTDAPKGSLADAYLTLAFATNGREY
ncbi:MAG: zf-HC2 domain-containing protein [Phycisphaerales bacterium]|jgi:predicted anti-sigma-YlaC factor YlaD